jgi:MFS family permease
MAVFKRGLSSITEGLPSGFWLIWTGTLVNRLGGFVIPFLTLYLTTRRLIPVSTAGVIVSLFGAGSFIAQLVGGELTDRLGRRPVMLMSFFITPVFMIMLGFATDLTLIGITTFMVGFFTDLYRPAVGAAIADLVPAENRARAYAYNYWAINLGAAVAPAVAGLIADANYQLLFIADGVTTALTGLIVLLGIRETRPAEAHAAAHAGVRERMGQLRRSPVLLIFSLLALFFGIVYTQCNVTLPLDMQADGFGPDLYGLTAAVNGLLIILVTIPISNVVIRWPRFETMAGAAVLLGLGFGLTALASTLPVYILSVVIWTLGEILASTVAPVIIADLSPVELRGLYQGIFGAAWGLSYFVGPLAGSWVYEHWGNLTLWAICLGIGIAAAFCYLLMRQPRGTPEVSETVA